MNRGAVAGPCCAFSEFPRTAPFTPGSRARQPDPVVAHTARPCREDRHAGAARERTAGVVGAGRGGTQGGDADQCGRGGGRGVAGRIERVRLGGDRTRGRRHDAKAHPRRRPAVDLHGAQLRGRVGGTLRAAERCRIEAKGMTPAPHVRNYGGPRVGGHHSRRRSDVAFASPVSPSLHAVAVEIHPDLRHGPRPIGAAAALDPSAVGGAECQRSPPAPMPWRARSQSTLRARTQHTPDRRALRTRMITPAAQRDAAGGPGGVDTTCCSAKRVPPAASRAARSCIGPSDGFRA